jgi:NADPH2:quinone reductase
MRIAEVPNPVPGSDEVRIEVHAASVNFPDVLLVANQYQVKVAAPFIPGSEFAGVVLEAGPAVTHLAPGDRVFGTSMVGAFAEQIVVAATSVTPIPDGIDERTAAAFGVAHRTAYHTLRSVARVKAGEELVVLGAGGGVGLATVQIGHVLGARVTAVASSDAKLGVAAAHGADRGVNYRTADLRQSLKDRVPGGADIVVDPVGGELSEPALRSLRWGGRFVTVGYASGVIPKIPLNLVLLKGVQILGFEFRSFTTNQAEELNRNERELVDLLTSGRASPHIGAVFPLSSAADALRHVADGKAIGKVILDVKAARA